MNSLSRLLSPVDLGKFFDFYWGINFLKLDGPADKFSDVLTIGTFRQLIIDYSPFLASPRVTMYAKGDILHESRFTRGEDIRISGALGYREELFIDLQKIEALLAKGATLKISQVDKFFPHLQDFATALSEEINERLHINLYYSSPDTNAFDPHFDKHDVFILQTHGQKLWHVFEHQEKAPLPGLKKRKTSAYSGSPKHEFLLSQGDLLYLPRGMWHYACTTECDSLHVTIGVECATSIELMRWIVDCLIVKDELRANLPIAEQVPENLKSNMQAAFMEILQDDNKLKEFYQERRRRSNLMHSIHMPDA